MTITFPRDLPTIGFVQGSAFYLQRQVTMAPTRGGLVQVAELGAPLWRARYQTPPLVAAQGAAWDAWLNSLRAGAKTFKATHPFLRYARAYPTGYAGMTKHGGGSFDGTAVLQAVATALDTVTLSGLPSAFVLTAGDFLSFVPSSTKQALHRVVEGGTASAGVVTVAVEPTVRPGFTLSANVALGSPWFKAVLDQQQSSVDWHHNGTCSVSLEAWQTLAA